MARDLLNDQAVKRAKPGDKPYRLADGASLYLYVAPSGVKSWQFRYRLAGKPQTASLGKYPNVMLAGARKKAEEARGLAEQGKHVTVEKKLTVLRTVADTKSTFGAVAHRWVRRRAKRKAWSEDYVLEVEASIRNHLAPLLALPVSEINARVCAPVLEAIEESAPFMAEKVRPRLHAVLDFAVTQGLLAGNPLPRTVDDVRLARRHFPAVTKLADLGEILRKARAADPSKGVMRAHEMLVFTAQRVSEVTGATWAEIDLDAGTWVIPRSRMKAHKSAERGAHEVPLPRDLAAKLSEWKAADAGTTPYVCPAPRDPSAAITAEAVEKFYRRALGLGGKHSPHSWRSAFSTICRDAGKDGDVIEAQLDHVVGSKVAAAYDRSTRLELRRKLIEWYSHTLVAARDGASVTALRKQG